MIEPDWKDVTPQPLGYISADDLVHLQGSAAPDVCAVAVSMRQGEATDVPVYLAPIVPSGRAGQPRADYPCRSDGRCQYAIDHGAEGLGHCRAGMCFMKPKPGQPQEYMRGYSDHKARAVDVLTRMRDEYGFHSDGWGPISEAIRTLMENEAAR